ncbi:type II toxin-antitoxin system prevent-host-death family antitoxin [Sphingomonas sp.]|jgi:prevent-host-death family protein|uniref:type II toxin-antitoxin system Phd/YefM family antitoxin n=1 Tax=Sphingomonas sp. TaxID=28214 RepID=UPI002D80D9B9|nr:type II toxin-antitoxin system prevent-host-death family antitoxin [Sphingomonas sp.]HEU0045600.1 type II toxin-antitoxin system prevent-host-death family antitoxin [Sphingomonas sp.]
MATTVTVHEAKTHLSRLIARALEGEDVVIARGTVPKVRLVPVENASVHPPRVPGSMKGQFTYAPDAFDALTDEELAEWGLL